MGWPDWLTRTLPGKSMFHPGQIPWGLWWVGELPRWSATLAIDFTVPLLYNYHLTLALINCEWTGRQRVTLSITPGLDSDWWFNGEFVLPLHPASGMMLQPGTNIKIYLFNNDTIARRFTGTLVGILERVP